MVKPLSEQSMRVSPRSGCTPPLHTRFGQPGSNSKANGGRWRKADTPRYKLEKMMTLTEEELLKIVKDKDAPYFERKLAIAINKSDWNVIERMTNQVYGKPKETVETIDTTPKEIKIEVLKAKSKKNEDKKDDDK